MGLSQPQGALEVKDGSSQELMALKKSVQPIGNISKCHGYELACEECRHILRLAEQEDCARGDKHRQDYCADSVCFHCSMCLDDYTLMSTLFLNPTLYAMQRITPVAVLRFAVSRERHALTRQRTAVGLKPLRSEHRDALAEFLT